MILKMKCPGSLDTNVYPVKISKNFLKKLSCLFQPFSCSKKRNEGLSEQNTCIGNKSNPYGCQNKTPVLVTSPTLMVVRTKHLYW